MPLSDDDAIALAKGIIEDAADLPERMEGLADKATEWAQKIMETVERTGQVSDKQEEILEDYRSKIDNIQDGATW